MTHRAFTPLVNFFVQEQKQSQKKKKRLAQRDYWDLLMYDYQEGGRTASDSKFLHGEIEFKMDTVIEYKRMFLSLPFEIYPRF